ncbi:hypothetical protein FJZ28_01105 [Candidatus Peregrinibacteria bacterium]|nr:hypothetical protein [Candidatus Peregrinibacteria bacterium]
MKFPVFSALQLHPVLCYLSGAGLLSIAALLMVLHVNTISRVRDVSVPIVSEIPQLERRLALLQEQTELTELHAATIVGSPEEHIRIFALPEQTDLGRLMAVFDVVREVYGREGTLTEMSDIVMGDAVDKGNGLRAQTVSLEFIAHEDAMRSVLLLIRLAGLMTVGDALSEQERALLLQAVETENPAGIIALEEFLSVQLQDFAENPKLYEDQLLRSFSTPAFLNTFHAAIRSSLLREAQELLSSDLGGVLVRYKLWPLQIMTVDTVSLRPGSAPKWHRIGLQFTVFTAPN